MNDSGQENNGRDYWDAAVLLTPAAQKLLGSTSILQPYEEHKVDVTILLLCHDNEAGILATLDTIIEAMDVIEKTFEIIIIDDASKDRSVELIRGYIMEFPKLNILLRINKRRKRLYQNYVDGAFIGCGKYFRLVYADNSEPVETMVDGMRAIGEADIIIPYYVSMHRKGLWERFTTYGYSWLANVITGNHINYYGSQHVHLRYNVMRWRSASSGKSFQAELLCQLLAYGFTSKQVPCRAVPQRMKAAFAVRVSECLSNIHSLIELFLRRISDGLNGRGH